MFARFIRVSACEDYLMIQTMSKLMIVKTEDFFKGSAYSRFKKVFKTEGTYIDAQFLPNDDVLLIPSW